MIQLPVSTDKNQLFNITLNNQQVNIELRWQDIGSSWYISIYDYQTNAPFIISHRLLPNRLVFGIKYTSFIGDIFAYNIAFPDVDLPVDGFQNGFGLYYIDADEKEQVKGLIK